MGEYAEQYILDAYGIDISEDDRPIPPKPVKKYGCKCGRMFISQAAKDQHYRDKHEDKNGNIQANHPTGNQ